MKRLMLSLLLLGGAASAEAPAIDLVPICQDGELRGLVVQAFEPGIYPIRWPRDVCKNKDA